MKELSKDGIYMYYKRMVTYNIIFHWTKNGGLHNRRKPERSSVIMGLIAEYPDKVLE